MLSTHELLARPEALGMAGFLLTTWLKATALLALAGILAAVLKKSPASSRHLVWGVGLSALLVLPVLPFLLPRLNVPIWSSAGSFSREVKRPGPALTRSADRALAASAESVPAAAIQIGSEPFVGDAVSSNLGRASSDEPITNLAGPPRARDGELRWSMILLLVWLAGFLVSLSRWMTGVFGAWTIVRRSYPVASPQCIAEFGALSDSLALGRSVRLLEYDGGSMPMTCGMMRPTIVLPASHREWPAERRRVVLLHELFHVKRWDCMAQAVAQIACALYWVTPLVWLAARRLRLESENACDDAVIGSGTKASAYAGHLLDIARTFSLADSGPRSALTIARPSQLESRLRSILNPNRQDRPGRERLQSALVSLGLLTLALGLAAMTPYPRRAGAEGSPPVEITEHSYPAPSASAALRYQESTDGLTAQSAKQALGDTAGLEPSKAEESEDSRDKGSIPAIDDKWTAISQPAAESYGSSFAVEHAANDLNAQGGEQETKSGVAPDARRVAQDALAGALKDSDEGVRAQAAWALGLKGDGRAVEPLTLALKDESALVRSQAAWALGLKGDGRAIEPLISALKDREAQVRSQAAWALGLKGDGRAVEPLSLALKDESAQVRSQAAWALGLKGDGRAVERLTSALKDQEAQVRSQAAWALGLKGDGRAVEPLISALKDPEAQVRSQAAWALGMRGDVRAVDALKALLNDTSNRARRQAGWALGMLLMRSGGGDGDEDEDEWDGDDSARAGSNPHPHSHPHAHVNAAQVTRRAN